MDQWVLILTSASFGGIVGEIARLIRHRMDGRSEQKRLQATDLVTQRDNALKVADFERDRATKEQDRGDREARNRNRAQDYAAMLRRELLSHGISPDDIPIPPVYER